MIAAVPLVVLGVVVVVRSHNVPNQRFGTFGTLGNETEELVSTANSGFGRARTLPRRSCPARRCRAMDFWTSP